MDTRATHHGQEKRSPHKGRIHLRRLVFSTNFPLQSRGGPYIIGSDLSQPDRFRKARFRYLFSHKATRPRITNFASCQFPQLYTKFSLLAPSPTLSNIVQHPQSFFPARGSIWSFQASPPPPSPSMHRTPSSPPNSPCPYPPPLRPLLGAPPPASASASPSSTSSASASSVATEPSFVYSRSSAPGSNTSSTGPSTISPSSLASISFISPASPPTGTPLNPATPR